MSKRWSKSGSFLTFHHTAEDHGSAAAGGVVAAYEVGVQGGRQMISCGVFGVAAGPAAAVWVSVQPHDSNTDPEVRRTDRGRRSDTAVLYLCSRPHDLDALPLMMSPGSGGDDAVTWGWKRGIQSSARLQQNQVSLGFCFCTCCKEVRPAGCPH